MPAREPTLPAIPRPLDGLSARRIDDSIALLRLADGTAIPRGQESVTIPSLPVFDPGDQLLLEDGSFLLFEDGSTLLLDSSNVLLEDGSLMLFEDGSFLMMEV